jgi:hypothetical protein
MLNAILIVANLLLALAAAVAVIGWAKAARRRDGATLRMKRTLSESDLQQFRERLRANGPGRVFLSLPPDVEPPPSGEIAR